MRYSKKHADIVLKEYAMGRTLKDILTPKGMPDRVSVYKWRFDIPVFGTHYNMAAKAHAHALVDIARNKVMTADSKNAKLADVQQRFLTWCASKIDRDNWGEKIQLEAEVIVDVAPMLQQALKRLSTIKPLPLQEAKAKQIS
ncbi:MAG: hypothetical protein DRI46_09385 [Chloroflexi bacterium]|nr:MAG: hypothetical protein DRI46_09385 [Chloroflexota bacterium]